MNEVEQKAILETLNNYKKAVKQHQAMIEALKELGIVICYEGDKNFGTSLRKGLPKMIEATGCEWTNKKDCIGVPNEAVREIKYKGMKFHQEGKKIGEYVWE